MKHAPLPHNEFERLNLLIQLGLLDSDEEKAYDNITELAASFCDVPISLITLLDEKRQWFKSHYGLNLRETSREIAICAHAINENDVFIVPDTRKDERFFDNPLVTGPPYIVFYAGAQLRLPSGHNVGTLCVIDTVSRKLSKKQVHQLELLAQQTVELFLMRSRSGYLQLLEAAKNKWLANISHDLKTPASAISGFTSLLDDFFNSASNDELMNYTKAILRNSYDLLDLIDDIGELVRIEEDAIEIVYKEFRLNELLQEICVNLQGYCQEFNSSLTLVNSDRDIIVYSDPRRLKQIVSNLVINGAKYSYDNSEVQVRLKDDSGGLRLEVINQGAGILPKDIPLLFERYFRADTNHDVKSKGLGLGLYLSQRLAEHMGTRIKVQSTPGQTTIFTLPLSPFNR